MRKACCNFATKIQKEKGVYNGLKSPCKRPFNMFKINGLRVRMEQRATLATHPFVMRSEARRW